MQLLNVKFADDVESRQNLYPSARLLSSRRSLVPPGLNLINHGSINISVFGLNFYGPAEFCHLPCASVLENDVCDFIEGAPFYNGLTSLRRSNSDASSRIDVSGRSSGFQSSYTSTRQFGTVSQEPFVVFPIKYRHRALEHLYALNLSYGHYLLKHFTILVSFLLVPARSIKFSQGAWQDEEYIYTIYHILMGTSCFLFCVPMVTFRKKWRHLTEKLCYISLGFLGFSWGIWQILGATSLGDEYQKSQILQVVTSHDALLALSYIYGFLPIVILDAFLPSRTRFTLFIHLQFVILYSSSAIIAGILHSQFIHWIYVFIRVLGYMSISVLLFFGSCSTEVQIRFSFYNWISTSRKIAKLEGDLQVYQQIDIPTTPADRIITKVLNCNAMAMDMALLVEAKLPEVSDTLRGVCTLIEECVTELTNSPNLYRIPLDCYKTKEQKSVIDAYIVGPNSNRIEEYDSVSFSTYEEEEDELTVTIKEYGFASLLPKEPMKTVDIFNLHDLLEDWNFSLLELFSKSECAFHQVGSSLLQEYQKEYNVPIVVMYNFLAVLNGLYHESVPYHNAIHGAMVAHKVACLANFLGVYGVMSSLEVATLVVAALGHDVGHPGRNNAFLCNSQDPVARLFNDVSVLENYHACCTFNVLKIPECNVFANLTRQQSREVRQRIVALILATDMADHFEKLSKFRLHVNAIDLSRKDDIWFINEMLIKAADLSATAMPWKDTFEWSQRLYCEFYDQGNDESRRNLPISSLCDVKCHSEAAKSQVEFLNIMVLPLYIELDKVNPGVLQSKCLDQIQSNIRKWRQMVKLKEEIPLLKASLKRNVKLHISWLLSNM